MLYVGLLGSLYGDIIEAGGSLYEAALVAGGSYTKLYLGRVNHYMKMHLGWALGGLAWEKGAWGSVFSLRYCKFFRT